MKQWMLVIAFVLCIFSTMTAQKKSASAPQPLPTALTQAEKSIIGDLQYRLIGPFRGGRSAAVTASYQNKNTYFFGATGGGVWKTADGGANWKNISDGFFGSSIGAVAVAPSDEQIMYVGEGEHTVRGNVSEGLGGMWKSEDGGKTWKNIGLKDGRHIVRIHVHPRNADVVWAAVQGHLFGPNEERGVYKTTDGGKTWKRVLFINNQTGAAELSLDPNQPNVLYAGMWRILRTPYSLESGGEGSGLWKSTDGGETWTNISNNKGFPKGTWGIVGVAVAPSNSDKVYALIEHAQGGLYVSNNAGESWTLVNSDNNIRQRAWYYTKIFVDTKNENVVYCPNVGFMRSRDGGRSFQSIPTPHSDHHDLWIDPKDPNRMIVADDGGAQVSIDGGQSWSTMMNQPTAQVYRVSTDNAFPYRILGGQQDNSAFRIKSRTYGAGITNNDLEVAAGSESGYVVADPLNPEITYGGNYMGMLQRLDHKTGESRLINVYPIDNMGAGAEAAKYRFQWNYPIFFSPHNPKRLYAAGNHLFVTENEGRSWQKISPDLTTDDKTRQKSSGGPITQDNTSVEYYCTIFTATESSVEKDLLWVGSDDGLIHVSKDGGKNWENVTPKNIPQWMMWNTVEVDPHKKGAAYFVGTRYKLNDYTPYIYKTEDYGKTWKLITTGIDPMHFTRVVRADPSRAGLLFAGTEFGMYMSWNDGATWKPFQLNLPVVPITDMTIKDNDLIVATQGRSIYSFDHLHILQQFQENTTTKALHVYEPEASYRMPMAGRRFRGPGMPIPNTGSNPANGVLFHYWLSKWNDSSSMTITIRDAQKKTIKSYGSKGRDAIEPKNGLNTFEWDMLYPESERVEGLILWNGYVGTPKAAPGKYYATFKLGSDSVEMPFTIVSDPNFSATDADYQEQVNFLLTIREKFTDVMKTIRQIREVRTQLTDLTTRVGKEMPKDLKEQIDAVQKEMTSIEEALHQTKAKSGQDVLNYPIRLDDKIASVYNVVSTGNTAPTQQSKEAFAELAGLTDKELSRWNTVVKEKLPQLNQMIREKAVPVIGIK